MKKSDAAASSTPFDDTFKTTIQRMPGLLIPLVSEVYDTSYDLDTDSVTLENPEHQTRLGRRYQDCRFRIYDSRYCCECQSTEDASIVLRLLEYAIADALEEAYGSGKYQGNYRMVYPQAFILNLRGKKDKVYWENISVEFPSIFSIDLRIPTICPMCYTLDEIQKKKLFFFLPFYFMRYEDSIKDPHSNKEELLRKLNQEYISIRDFLLESYPHAEISCYPYFLMELVDLVLTAILPKEGKFRKDVETIMGGHAIRTPTMVLWDKALAKGIRQGTRTGRQEGWKQGRELGLEQGRELGLKQGIEAGQKQAIIQLIKNSDISIQKGAQVLKMSVEELEKML